MPLILRDLQSSQNLKLRAILLNLRFGWWKLNRMFTGMDILNTGKIFTGFNVELRDIWVYGLHVILRDIFGISAAAYFP